MREEVPVLRLPCDCSRMTLMAAKLCARARLRAVRACYTSILAMR
jgi:hypothetical protein